jgi:hypothetical protein
MKLLFRNYLASLRERDELDAVLPDLLSELGFVVYSRPQRGTAQAGVDIAAVGKDEDGERKVFLFSVKQGDLTRQAWNDGSAQGLRPSLDEILDNYIPHRIPDRYKKLKIVICMVFGGDMQEQVRSTVNGYTKGHSTRRISFDEWNGDKLAGLLLQGVLREEIMPKSIRSHFQKAVALVDEPDIAYRHFARLVGELVKRVNGDRASVRTARQMYIAVWVLFVWARDIDNVEAPYRASELVLLNIWSLVRPYIGKKSSVAGKSITMVLNDTIRLHVAIAAELLERKVLKHAGTMDGISMAVQSRSSVDVNIRLFDILGRVALTGLWLVWFVERDPDAKRRAAALAQATRWVALGYQLIENNRALFLPLQDQQGIDVMLFLLLVSAANGNLQDTNVWLNEMVGRLCLTVRTHGRYPCVFGDYRDLAAHPREKTDDYRKEATPGSILVPVLAAFLAALGNQDAVTQLMDLKANELEHCTLQLWTPDKSSEDAIYLGSRDHGVAICDLPITPTGESLFKTLRDACAQTEGFGELSAIATGFWPIILTACRHYRLPVPPQLWLDMVDPKSASSTE